MIAILGTNCNTCNSTTCIDDTHGDYYSSDIRVVSTRTRKSEITPSDWWRMGLGEKFFFIEIAKHKWMHWKGKENLRFMYSSCTMLYQPFTLSLCIFWEILHFLIHHIFSCVLFVSWKHLARFEVDHDFGSSSIFLQALQSSHQFTAILTCFIFGLFLRSFTLLLQLSFNWLHTFVSSRARPS